MKNRGIYSGAQEHAITRWIETGVKTTRTYLSAKQWCESERTRLAQKGVSTRIEIKTLGWHKLYRLVRQRKNPNQTNPMDNTIPATLMEMSELAKRIRDTRSDQALLNVAKDLKADLLDHDSPVHFRILAMTAHHAITMAGMTLFLLDHHFEIQHKHAEHDDGETGIQIMPNFGAGISYIKSEPKPTMAEAMEYVFEGTWGRFEPSSDESKARYERYLKSIEALKITINAHDANLQKHGQNPQSN